MGLGLMRPGSSGPMGAGPQTHEGLRLWIRWHGPSTPLFGTARAMPCPCLHSIPLYFSLVSSKFIYYLDSFEYFSYQYICV